jgi:hypothetical protein
MTHARLAFVAAITAAFLGVGTSVASASGGMNGEPHFAPPPVGGGTGNGIGMLGGSYQSDGTLIVGIGTVTNALHLATGVWETDFRRDLRGCVWTGTIGLGTFGGSATGEIEVTGRAGNFKGLFVETLDSAGNHSDLPFEVNVICG